MTADMALSVVGLIPARAGSRRVPGKNVRLLRGHPLLAYTVSAALTSGVFGRVVLSTESEEVASVGRHYGSEVPFLRPKELAGDLSPDIEWVRYTLDRLRHEGGPVDAFAILRPTSPLRTSSTIVRAWRELMDDPEADSLRAVERCRQHPAKMWVIEDNRMRPFVDDERRLPPSHSLPYQALPPVYAQNASLEFARMRAVDKHGTISGSVIRPFLTNGYEGFDINDPMDWVILERLVDCGAAVLPNMEQAPFVGDTCVI